MTDIGDPRESRDPVLLFDGDCAFCTLWIDRLREALPVFPEAIPHQWADLDALGLSHHDVDSGAWLITASHQYGGHLSLSALLRMQPRIGLRFVGNLIATPPFSLVAVLAYRLVARYRHRLPGGTPACALPRDGATT